MRGFLSWLIRSPLKWVLLVVATIVGISNALILWYGLARFYLNDNEGAVNNYLDSLHMAVELGRLDVISALLALVALGLGVLAFSSFGYIKHRSESVARQTASETASEVAQKVANEYFTKRGLEESDRGVTSPTDSGIGEVDVSTSDLEDEEASNNDS